MSGKKYFWLKLKRDFFKRHDIQIIEAMDNGKDYVLFYLKILLESIDHEGNLRFSATIPYNEKMLAIITNTNVDIVKSAMDKLIALGLVEILSDSTIYMNEVEKMLGAESYWAEQKRNKRKECNSNLKEIGQCPTCPTVVQPLSTQEIEKEIEKEIEIDNTSSEILQIPDRIPYQKIVAAFNEICTSLTKVKGLTEGRKSVIKARYKDLGYSMDKVKEYFTKVQASDFLTGKVEREGKRPFKATFDWVIKSANFVKIIEGNYENKEASYGTSGKLSTEAKNVSKWGNLEGIIHL